MPSIKKASVAVPRLEKAVEYRLATPRADSFFVRLGKSKSSATPREAEKSGALIDGLIKATRKPGFRREVVFRPNKDKGVYAYSIYPGDVTKIVREDANGKKTLGRLICLAVACLALTVSLRAQSPSGNGGNPGREATLLELGKPIEREMRGGERHSYKVHAEAGQFVHVVALQEGIDVLVTLLDPSGKQILTVDSMNGSYGPEPVSIIAEDSGDLQLDVSTSPTDAPAGHYQIQLTDLRPPAEADRIRITAERTYMEGCLLYSRRTVGSTGAAAAKWQESFARWQSLDDKYGQALSLYSAGLAYNDVGEKQKALDYYRQALPLWRSVGDRGGEAATLNNIGQLYDDLGEKQKALDYFNQALPLRRAVGDRGGEATTLSNIGAVYIDLGEKQKALDYFDQALPVRRAVGDRGGEAATLNNIGGVYNDLGEKQKALDYYNQALPLRRAVGDRRGEAITLNNIGALYSELGEKQKALDYFNQALPLERAVGDRGSEATTLNNIGVVYNDLGEKQKALDYYNQALPLRARRGGPRGRGVYAEQHRWSLQRPGGEAEGAGLLTIRPCRSSAPWGTAGAEATTLNNIGQVYTPSSGEKQKALDYFSPGLPLSARVGDRAGGGDHAEQYRYSLRPTRGEAEGAGLLQPGPGYSSAPWGTPGARRIR